MICQVWPLASRLIVSSTSDVTQHLGSSHFVPMHTAPMQVVEDHEEYTHVCGKQTILDYEMNSKLYLRRKTEAKTLTHLILFNTQIYNIINMSVNNLNFNR